ncbi:hypothetical protein [Jannaschia sp. W003]|uniref:hypothetical protein n=1 Tax=Jannaschia sp. W003 TaxID=2867012 RepID=UPI0021A52801|nr:hypothetical protein [Jannaschia sp. W003]UWQ22295.1 hypothetical protein K3554_04480 [Jannaschia sp. W003]
MASKILLAIGAAATLSACGGGARPNDVTVSSISNVYSTGPIQRACLTSDRRAVNGGLCGCVQAAADATISGSDQSRAVEFFRDPHHAQEVRQSDDASDEAYWKRYKRFVSVAERACG